jgi:hypothetical protein
VVRNSSPVVVQVLRHNSLLAVVEVHCHNIPVLRPEVVRTGCFVGVRRTCSGRERVRSSEVVVSRGRSMVLHRGGLVEGRMVGGRLC